MENLGRLLIILGVAFLALGALFLYSDHYSFLRLGRLPGDITIKRDNFSLYFPITTCTLISAVISLVVYLLRRW